MTTPLDKVNTSLDAYIAARKQAQRFNFDGVQFKAEFEEAAAYIAQDVVAPLKAELDDSNEAKAQLLRQVSEATELKTSVDAENVVLRRRIDDERFAANEKTTELTRQLTDSRAEKDDAERRLGVQATEIVRLENAVEAATQQKTSDDAKVDSVTQQLTKVVEEKSELQRRFDAINAERNQLTQQLATAKRENGDLQRQFDETSAAKNAAELKLEALGESLIWESVALTSARKENRRLTDRQALLYAQCGAETVEKKLHASRTERYETTVKTAGVNLARVRCERNGLRVERSELRNLQLEMIEQMKANETILSRQRLILEQKFNDIHYTAHMLPPPPPPVILAFPPPPVDTDDTGSVSSPPVSRSLDTDQQTPMAALMRTIDRQHRAFEMQPVMSELDVTIARNTGDEEEDGGFDRLWNPRDGSRSRFSSFENRDVDGGDDGTPRAKRRKEEMSMVQRSTDAANGRGGRGRGGTRGGGGNKGLLRGRTLNDAGARVPAKKRKVRKVFAFPPGSPKAEIPLSQETLAKLDSLESGTAQYSEDERKKAFHEFVFEHVGQRYAYVKDHLGASRTRKQMRAFYQKSKIPKDQSRKMADGTLTITLDIQWIKNNLLTFEHHIRKFLSNEPF